MDDRLTRHAIEETRRVKKTQRKQPWWLQFLGAVLALLMIAGGIFIAGTLASIVWQLFLLGWEGL